MIKLFLTGINGRMGRMITERAGLFGASVTGGFDEAGENTLPVFAAPEDVDSDFDVIVDFSHPSALGKTAALALRSGKPVVLATTGYSGEDEKTISGLAGRVAVFRSANMSLGINALVSVLPEFARILGGYDIEITEAHHRMKKDAPSGTALMLEKAVEKGLDYEPGLKFGRSGQDPRVKGEIGIHAVRGGTIVGEHTVLFAGEDEMIEIKHTALSRKILADGALKAAAFIAGKKPGLYSMQDLVKA